MDGLSGASGVIAVVSVAVQLAESIKQLVEFGKAVEDAPPRISALFHDLEVLESVISEFRRIDGRITFNGVNEVVIKNCQQKVSTLQTTIQPAILKLKSNKVASRKWGAFKITLKREEIQSLQKSIEEAKSTLQLVQNNSLLELLFSTISNQSKVVSGIEALTSVVQQSLTQRFGFETPKMHIHGLNDTCDEACTPGFQTNSVNGATAVKEISTTASREVITDYSDCSVIKPFRSFDFQTLETRSSRTLSITIPFVKVEAQSRTYQRKTFCSSEVYETLETDVTCVVYPNAGGKILGMSRGVLLSGRATSGWQFSIQPFRAVPENALIFEFCRNGNLEAVRSLFERGEASPWDRDPAGLTPLWVASRALQLDVAKLLLSKGADPHARSWWYNQEPICAITYSQTEDIDPKLAMINLFQRYRREDYHDESTLQIIGRSMLYYRPQKGIKMPWTQRCDAILKLVSTLVPTLHSHDPNRASVIFGAVDFYYEQEVLRWLLCTTKAPLIGSSDYSTVHEAIHRRLLERDLRSMKLIIEQTKNLHLCAKKSSLQTEVETPTMLAMYDMNTFCLWRQMLRELGHDTQEFVRGELQEGPLRRAGWTQDSLSYLFDMEISPDPHTTPVVFRFPRCQRCGHNGTKLGSKLMVDLNWRRQLRDIRLQFSNRPLEILDPSTSGSCMVDNTDNPEIPYNCSSTKLANKDQEEVSSTISFAAAQSKPLLYRIVCSGACQDAICVAILYDNDSTSEPDLPLYYNEDSSKSGERGQLKALEPILKDGCPTYGMPGAFKTNKCFAM